MIGAYGLAKALLFRCEPEHAHELSLRALKLGLVPPPDYPRDARLRIRVAGLDFPNPLGLAAGYDKNAEVVDPILRLGFGFTEVGTLTPRPQAGNPRPRVFRLPEEEAIINRLGFNNGGHAAALARLARRAGRPGIVGVNVGANRDAADRVADYVAGVRLFAPVADYLTINISSPNTPGLRDLQSAAELRPLLEAAVAARNAAVRGGRRTNLFLKVAPDLEAEEIQAVASAATASAIDGLIVSNTTVSRPHVRGSRHAGEAGGLSGRPLMDLSTWALAAFREAVGPAMPLIGLGGVDSDAAALAKIEAGADLVQLYTGLVYRGPALPALILSGMLRHLDRQGVDHVSALRDRSVAAVLRRGRPDLSS